RCVRTGDIDEVGDSSHLTFFEMLGNWSLGDYWKKEAIEYSLEFLIKILGIPKEKLEITCFKGDKDSPKDLEAEKIWKSLGIKKIKFLGKEDNWWGPAGETGPCGPDTEIFVKNIEIWNNVFMEYKKINRLILVDGMHCLYDKNFEINKDLLDLINKFNTHTVLTVNGFREKGLNLVKNYDKNYDPNWEAFSLEEKEIKKDNPEYFKELLKTFNLVPEEVIYFDHDKKNVEIAKNLDILSINYSDNESTKKFIGDNLYCYIPSKQKNVDTGMGVERTIAILNNLTDIYLTDSFKPIIEKIEEISKKKYKGNEKAMRIIADHIKASVFIIADGILPGNKEQGYVLRRLIRRAVRYGKELGIKNFTNQIAEPVFDIYNDYSELKNNKTKILEELKKEEQRFNQTLEKGLNEFNKLTKDKN
ncbi:MAG: alanine--tRNA ligase-related protein, partial [Nanoarchaeota archaeon]